MGWSGEKEHLSKKDEAQWARTVELLPQCHTSSDVHDLFDLTGGRAAILGPGTPPVDVLGIEMCYRLGPSGTLYSIDPQGDKKGPGIVAGEGNSQEYERKMNMFRALGFPFASFKWLGPDSSLGSFPKKVKNLDLFADHWTLEFVGTCGRVTNEYMQDGLKRIIKSLLVGGLFVHHAVDEVGLPAYSMSATPETLYAWLQSQGLRLTHVWVAEDSYRLPMKQDVLDDFFATDAPERIFTSDAADKIRMASYEQNALVIPESVIAYRSRHVLIGQRMW